MHSMAKRDAFSHQGQVNALNPQSVGLQREKWQLLSLKMHSDPHSHKPGALCWEFLPCAEKYNPNNCISHPGGSRSEQIRVSPNSTRLPHSSFEAKVCFRKACMQQLGYISSVYTTHHFSWEGLWPLEEGVGRRAASG